MTVDLFVVLGYYSSSNSSTSYKACSVSVFPGAANCVSYAGMLSFFRFKPTIVWLSQFCMIDVMLIRCHHCCGWCCGCYCGCNSTGIVTNLAGGGSIGNFGYEDGTGSVAMFYSPTGLAVSTSGTVYVADTGNNLIRMISPAGLIFSVSI